MCFVDFFFGKENARQDDGNHKNERDQDKIQHEACAESKETIHEQTSKFEKNAPSVDRTQDPLIKSQLLYQLS